MPLSEISNSRPPALSRRASLTPTRSETVESDLSKLISSPLSFVRRSLLSEIAASDNIGAAANCHRRHGLRSSVRPPVAGKTRAVECDQPLRTRPDEQRVVINRRGRQIILRQTVQHRVATQQLAVARQLYEPSARCCKVCVLKANQPSHCTSVLDKLYIVSWVLR